VIFRRFCTPDQDISYLLADPVGRYAAVLDPDIGAESGYLEIVRRFDLRLIYIIETHLHEFHLSGTGATHSSVDVDSVDMHVDDGDRLYVGKELLSVVATPGHSACSLSYLWRDRVFTGHTLLPDETLVYPGRVTDRRRISSIGQERAANAANNDLQPQTSREQFAKRKQLQAMHSGPWQAGCGPASPATALTEVNTIRMNRRTSVCRRTFSGY